jgi:hypothetical protein
MMERVNPFGCRSMRLCRKKQRVKSIRIIIDCLSVMISAPFSDNIMPIAITLCFERPLKIIDNEKSAKRQLRYSGISLFYPVTLEK